MIGRLKGIIVEKRPPNLLIDVGGVGYELQASMTTFYQLPDVDQEIVLYTHLVVREDEQSLYGFYELRERALFRALIKVNGVGPKMALRILSSIDPDAFVRYIENDDIASLVHMPGVGKKTAERLIIEMRDRLSDWQSGITSNMSIKPSAKPIIRKNDVCQDAVRALIALGYKPQEASRLISKVFEEGLDSEQLIRRALQSLTKS